MNRGKVRWLLRLAVLPILGLAILLWALWGQPPNHLTVENRSGQPIASLRLRVGKEAVTFRDVPPGKEVATPFPVRTGSPYGVEGELLDGTRINMQGTARERANFIVLPGGTIAPRPEGKGSS